MLTLDRAARPLTLDEFAAALEAEARFEEEPFLALAVSGGPDSLALAILADRWARRRGGAVCALAVDHRLRPQSAGEIRALQGWLSARAIRLEALIWEGEKPASGIQEKARAARYRLLAGWCRDQGCLNLLTAHHREDQAETHLIRARAHSAADGLAGMSAVRELDGCRLLRPLLGFPKARLLALLEAERQPFITDPSNRDPAFERARLRASGSPADIETLSSAIRALGRERIERERMRDALSARAVSLHPAGFAAVDRDLLLAAPRDIAERLLAAVARTIGGGAYPARRGRVARLYEGLAGDAFRGRTLAGCRIVRWRGRILVMRELAAAEKPLRAAPGASLRWDRRFRVMLPAAAVSPAIIGYLGQARAAGVDCRAAQQRGANLPRLVHAVLPAAWDASGLAAAPALGYRRDGNAVAPRTVFAPVNSASSPGFALAPVVV